jgi:hypothetical protein
MGTMSKTQNAAPMMMEEFRASLFNKGVQDGTELRFVLRDVHGGEIEIDPKFVRMGIRENSTEIIFEEAS